MNNTTRQQNIDAVREACARANPEKFKEEHRDWEESFYESDWDVNTIDYSSDEDKWKEEMGSFLPRHMDVYDWNLPYIDYMILSIRRTFTNKIRLADVLHMFGATSWAIEGLMLAHGKGTTWNLLKDSLDEQSDETLEFISNLLKS